MVTVSPLLVLAVAMLGLLFAVTLGMLVFRDWYDYEPQLPQDTVTAAERFIKNPIVWMIAFFLGSLGLAGTVGYWLAAPEELQSTIALAAGAVIAVTLTVMVFVGVWDMIRSRGRSNSEAVGIGAIVLGLLFIAGIAVQLVIG